MRGVGRVFGQKTWKAAVVVERMVEDKLKRRRRQQPGADVEAWDQGERTAS